MNRIRSSQEKKRNLFENLAIALISLIFQAAVLILLSTYLPGLAVLSLTGAVLFVLVLGLANSFLIFPLINISVRLHPLLFPILVFTMNGILVLLAGSIFPDISISSIWTAITVSFVISTTGMIVGGAFAVDDCKSYRRFVIRPLMERYGGGGKKETVPGVVFLEIDGLSGEMLEKALQEGYMPTVRSWLESGSHKLTGWDTDLSCQTGGSQPGILHGNNSNIPGFRWFEKGSQQLYSSSWPGNVSEIEQRVSDGRGLLANNGSSRANMYSGDATESLLTVSTIGAGKRNTVEYFLFFANPYMLARTVGIFVSHLAEEVVEATFQLARRERPRINRFGYYPFIRALATAVLRELAVFALAGDMIRSLPAMYATFVGYDEVAHHSGVARKDAMRVLKGLDKMFERLESLGEITNRPYRFVVLSDHGQSNGATFRQRTGKTLEEAVGELVELKTFSTPSEDETWLRANSFLTDVSRQDSRSGRLVGRVIKGRMKEGGVTLGPRVKGLADEDGDGINGAGSMGINKAIVLASGNLGLIYFTASKERLSLEEIHQEYPHLISGLLKYPEIGFLMVRSAVQGPLVIGAKGVYHLWDGRVEGENPLENYGELASRQLIYEDSFTNCPDILVNSFYSQKMDEVAAFEELVGSHGGLGGQQTRGILIYPADLPLAREPIVGVSSLHRAIKQWVPAE